MKILIVDQFSGITPYWLSTNPTRFDDLIARVMSEPPPLFSRPRVIDDAPSTFHPPMCSTVLRANADGLAEVWLMRWDSSG